MIDPTNNAFTVKALGLLCLFILCGVLTAGLWPFHAPANDVAWLKDADGLVFGNHGTAVGSAMFKTSAADDESFCSLEISLQPRDVDDFSTILAFVTPEPAIHFSLLQFDADMGLQNPYRNSVPNAKGARVAVDVHNVFHKGELLLIAIASGPEGTSIYVNGVLLGTVGKFQLSAQDCSGQLILGTSPVVNQSWPGQLRELAIYQQELTPAQVSRHFETWAVSKRFDVGQDEHVLAIYEFNEHHGRVVHDSGGSHIDLSIPERYLIVHEKFLEPAWQEFHNDWGYWKNILINIGGFIPLGFCFYAYLTLASRLGRAALVTVILGAGVSITIEVLQAYLPTRDSGTTDIITNTLGTAIGVVLYRWQAPLVTEFYNRIRLMLTSKSAYKV